MADDDPQPPLPTPTAQTAIKQAVATAHDAPDGTPVDGESPLPPRPLFTMPQFPSAQDNIFDDSDDDAYLAKMPLHPSTSSRSRKRDASDDGDKNTAPDLSSPQPPTLPQFYDSGDDYSQGRLNGKKWMNTEKSKNDVANCVHVVLFL
eukprot:scaffold54895_cov113-Cyclotella_meneghiniana.AAC.1